MTEFPDITLKQDKTKGAKSTWYQVREDCYYHGLNLTIPEGFNTDLSSVPRLLQWFIPPFGIAVPASILHDYMYTYGWKSIKEADKLFYKILLTHNVPKWQSFFIYILLLGFLENQSIKENDK